MDGTDPTDGRTMSSETGQDLADAFGEREGHPLGPDVLPGDRAFWDLPPSEPRSSELRVVDGPMNGVVVPVIESESPLREPDVLPGDRMFWAAPLT